MTKEKINELLVNAIGKYSLMIGTKAAKDVAKKLSTNSKMKTFESNEKDAFLNARNAVMESGKILLEDRDSGIVEGIIYAGIANMNPAIVVISVLDKKITIAAYAKEGLIKQQTAQKAIERFCSAL